MKKQLNQLAKGDIFIIMMELKFYFKTKNPWWVNDYFWGFGGRVGSTLWG